MKKKIDSKMIPKGAMYIRVGNLLFASKWDKGIWMISQEHGKKVFYYPPMPTKKLYSIINEKLEGVSAPVSVTVEYETPTAIKTKKFFI